ncbi:MAG: hypothetical protein J1F40_07900, partial [Prevotellaceae bacterium]|nr:hypothetical protein [Prevotellaceae bacterium]
ADYCNRERQGVSEVRRCRFEQKRSNDERQRRLPFIIAVSWEEATPPKRNTVSYFFWNFMPRYMPL